MSYENGQIDREDMLEFANTLVKGHARTHISLKELKKHAIRGNEALNEIAWSTKLIAKSVMAFLIFVAIITLSCLVIVSGTSLKIKDWVEIGRKIEQSK